MSKVTYNLEGLGCANCANKIELAVQKIEGVTEAYVDFSTSKLVYKYDEHTSAALTDEIISGIVHTYEPDVKVILKESSNHQTPGDAHDHGELENEKFERYRLILSLIIFFSALLFGFGPTIKTSMYLIAYAISGYPVILKSLKNIANRQWFDENFLMFIATVGAFGIGEYPEAAAVMIFYEVGEYFQDLAVGKSRASIASLMNIRPEIAHVITEGQSRDVLPDQVQIGQIIRVRVGERIPLDGRIIKGGTSLDTSALTGESKPRLVVKGDDVLSGSVVINSVIDIEVTKAYRESTISKILELVEDATAHKAPTENFITKFARYYTPVVVLLAALIMAIPTAIYGLETFDIWLYRGLIFLVISCPCALVISVPLSFFSGIGNASKHGILVKGSNYLEALNTIDTLVFDKTGTLTHGNLKIKEIIPEGTYSEDVIMSIAKTAESHSNHPIAKAIMSYNLTSDAPKTSVGFSDLSEKYEEVGGKGIKAYFSGKTHHVGTRKLLEEAGIELSSIKETLGTYVYVAREREFLGVIVLEDQIKNEAHTAIRALHKEGKKVIMLTGDQEGVAKYVADTLNIDEYHSSLLPGDKYQIVSDLISSGRKVAFVGDGINDAPVLAGATIGISMGQLGSDAAIEASDIVIMKDDLSSIDDALKISHKTKEIVLQNIVFAIGIKVIIMILGTFGLSSMWMAIFADVGVALIAILNAMRILKFQPNSKVLQD